MANQGWRPFDYSRRDETRPPDNELVWIHDEHYRGVTIGYYDGWWRDLTGHDDISVTHWMPMDKPPAPAVAPEPAGASAPG